MGLKKRNKANAEFSMSSLTDIIFLLLIFFMLTSSLTTPNAQNLERPKSNSKTQSPQNVALSITSDGEFYIDAQKEPVPRAQLEQKLLEAINKERQNNLEKKIETEVTIVLNVEMTETTGTIVEYMKLSNKLGVRLILATEASDEQKEKTS
ncbi:MAG: Biopolymer transport protein ExbD/TolR [uncultured Aureispira sp.]|uniref:Biopolymer transport protein ExbD/TolR n=1 Tax=uncultured Aureispira sp. TaxID=1331704 RepID=A0A6S6U0C7_9BACT|nr:MAG: Biopolymer transport protein ExbD/TolR [uncultured Aureispira sp.]